MYWRRKEMIETMDYEAWLNKAVQRIATLRVGTEFVVKELFNGTDWNSLPRGDKLGFGKYFKSAVTDDKFSKVEYIGKAENNSAKYRKGE